MIKIPMRAALTIFLEVESRLPSANKFLNSLASISQKIRKKIQRNQSLEENLSLRKIHHFYRMNSAKTKSLPNPNNHLPQ
jgi:hypothetical protein